MQAPPSTSLAYEVFLDNQHLKLLLATVHNADQHVHTPLYLRNVFLQVADFFFNARQILFNLNNPLIDTCHDLIVPAASCKMNLYALN